MSKTAEEIYKKHWAKFENQSFSSNVFKPSDCDSWNDWILKAMEEYSQQERSPSPSLEVEKLKELLHEVCVRANIIFPEREGDIEKFDEQFKNSAQLFINLSAILGLGELEDTDIEENQRKYKEWLSEPTPPQGKQ